MTIEEVNQLVEKYQDEIPFELDGGEILNSQVTIRDRQILYAFIREFKPKSVIEYGTRYGGTTFPILAGLLKNEQPFRLFLFEKDDDARGRTMRAMKELLQKEIKVYGAIEDNYSKLPNDLDFGFIDHDHMAETTMFFLGAVLPKFQPKGLFGIHDWENGPFDESKIIHTIMDYLPIEKFYWTKEESHPLSVGWFKTK